MAFLLNKNHNQSLYTGFTYSAQEPPVALAAVFWAAQVDSASLFFLALNSVAVVPTVEPG